MFYLFIDGQVNVARMSKEIINTYAKALVLMATIYIIVAIVIFGYKALVILLTKDADSMYIVRVNVEDTYSFNTNATGFMKYKTLMPDYVGRFKNAFQYVLTVLFNFLYFMVMVARTPIVGILIIIAPITIVNYMRGQKAKNGNSIINLLYFNNWLNFFIRIVFVPILGIIAYKLLILTLV